MKLFSGQTAFPQHMRAMALKMISFAMIGLANAAVDLGVFVFTFTVLGLPLVPSNVLAWLVAVFGSYVMNTMITFWAESGRILRRRDYLNFAASGILGVVATTTTLVILSKTLVILSNYIAVIFAKLVSILVASSSILQCPTSLSSARRRFQAIIMDRRNIPCDRV